MDKNILRKFAIESRQELLQKMDNKIKTYYINENFSKEQRGDVYVLSNENNSLRLTNEEYEYLQSLINLEFSFLKYYLKSKNKSSILNDKLFYEAAIFNIYETVSEALKKIQSVRIISFAENQECKSVSTCISSLLIPSKESSKQEIFKLFNIEKSTYYKNPFEISIFSYGELYLNEIALPEYLVEVIEKRKQISALSSNIIFKSLEINQYKGFKYNSNII